MLVLALPRGGVPVGYEVAQALGAPLDVFLVRKLGVPGHEELAMGAIATGGVRVLNDEVVRPLNIPPEVIDAVAERERQELERRERAYRGGRPAAGRARPDRHPGRRRAGHRLDHAGRRRGAAAAAARPGRRGRARRGAGHLRRAPARGGRGGLRRTAAAVLRRRPLVRDFSQTSDEEIRTLLREAASPVASTRDR